MAFLLHSLLLQCRFPQRYPMQIQHLMRILLLLITIYLKILLIILQFPHPRLYSDSKLVIATYFPSKSSRICMPLRRHLTA